MKQDGLVSRFPQILLHTADIQLPAIQVQLASLTRQRSNDIIFPFSNNFAARQMGLHHALFARKRLGVFLGVIFLHQLQLPTPLRAKEPKKLASICRLSTANSIRREAECTAKKKTKGHP